MRLFIMCSFLVALFLAIGCSPEESPGKKELDLTVPEKTTLAREKEAEVVIRIQRHNFESPVTVKMSNFPEGVTVKKSTQNEIIYAAQDDEATFTLTANAMAEIGDHTVTVTGDVEDMSPVTKTFKLTVIE